MGAVAAGFYVTVAAAAIVALIIGAIHGAIFWRVRSGLALGSLVSLVVYLVVAFAFFGIFTLGAIFCGIIPLTLSFLSSYLIASYFNKSKGLRPIWSSIAAFSSSLAVGVLYMLSFRAGLWVPLVLGLVANGYLASLVIKSRGLVTS